MALILTPELEARLVTFARESAREPSTLLAELVTDAMDNLALADEALARAGETLERVHIRAGFAAIDNGQRVPHEQALARLHAAATGQTRTP
jgi:predicted transcriptional regulator